MRLFKISKKYYYNNPLPIFDIYLWDEDETSWYMRDTNLEKEPTWIKKLKEQYEDNDDTDDHDNFSSGLPSTSTLICSCFRMNIERVKRSLIKESNFTTFINFIEKNGSPIIKFNLQNDALNALKIIKREICILGV